jgi:hypothetical protein
MKDVMKSLIVCTSHLILLGLLNNEGVVQMEEQETKNCDVEVFRKVPLVILRRRWEDNIKVKLKEIDYEGLNWLRIMSCVKLWN